MLPWIIFLLLIFFWEEEGLRSWHVELSIYKKYKSEWFYRLIYNPINWAEQYQVFQQQQCHQTKSKSLHAFATAQSKIISFNQLTNNHKKLPTITILDNIANIKLYIIISCSLKFNAPCQPSIAQSPRIFLNRNEVVQNLIALALTQNQLHSLLLNQPKEYLRIKIVVSAHLIIRTFSEKEI